MSSPSTRSASRGYPLGARARAFRRRVAREAVYSDRPALILLVSLTLTITVLGVFFPDQVPQIGLLFPIVLGSFLLGPRSMPWYTVVNLLGVCLIVSEQDIELRLQTVLRITTTFAVALVVLVFSFRRSRLGVSGPRGESMFVDLRDRIAKQGQIPELPAGWFVESAIRSAGGTSFAGDFVVASRGDESTLDLVVVDVSGKGVEAGTRALLLSGAFGGLLSALRPEHFLEAANDFLLRQDWAEGFATAIALHLDLGSGAFALRKAGHPPAVHLVGGTGRWSVLESTGPVLGLIPGAEFEAHEGVLDSGDALMLYTDGLVETATRDIESGIDKLAGVGTRLFQWGFEGGADRVVREVGASDDDRALLLVHRR